MIINDPDPADQLVPSGADLIEQARQRVLAAMQALRRGTTLPGFWGRGPRKLYTSGHHGTYRVRDKGDGRAQERLDAAEAKRARRRERNLRNQRAQQYGGF
ncbi:MAG TPA: hypothetical protein PKW35_01405 [Nannocystaceae bacterium]|nr:hypothetical protein [Nannocystaceae bacterium]